MVIKRTWGAKKAPQIFKTSQAFKNLPSVFPADGGLLNYFLFDPSIIVSYQSFYHLLIFSLKQNNENEFSCQEIFMADF